MSPPDKKKKSSIDLDALLSKVELDLGGPIGTISDQRGQAAMDIPLPLASGDTDTGLLKAALSALIAERDNPFTLQAQASEFDPFTFTRPEPVNLQILEDVSSSLTGPDSRELGGELAGGTGGAALGGLIGTSLGGPLVGLLAAALGGGTGSQVGGELAELAGGTERGIGERLQRGTLEGALELVPGAKLLTKSGRAAYKGARQTGTDKATRALLEDFASDSKEGLSDEARTKIGANIARSTSGTYTKFDHPEDFDRYKTLGEASDNPGLANLEDAIKNSGTARSVEFANKAVERDKARDSLMDVLMPSPKSKKTERGEQLRGTLDARDDAYHKAVQEKYNSIDKTLIIDLTPTKEAATAAIKELADPKKEAKGLSSEAAAIVKGLEKKTNEKPVLILDAKGNPIRKPKKRVYEKTFEEVQNLKKRATNQSRAASRGDDPRPEEAKVMAMLAKSLDESVDKMVADGKLPKVEADKWREGRALRKEKGALFEEGVSKDILAKERNLYVKAAEDIEKSLIEGKVTNVTQMLKANPESKPIIKEALQDKLQENLRTQAQSLKFSSLNNFLNKNDEVLEKLYSKEHVNMIRKVKDDLSAEAVGAKLAQKLSKGQSATAKRTALIKQLGPILKSDEKSLGSKVRDMVIISSGAAAGGTFGGSLVGGPAGAIVGYMGMQGYNKLKKVRAEQLLDSLVDHLLDPQKAKLLLEKGTAENLNKFLDISLKGSAKRVAGAKGGSLLIDTLTPEE